MVEPSESSTNTGSPTHQTEPPLPIAKIFDLSQQEYDSLSLDGKIKAMSDAFKNMMSKAAEKLALMQGGYNKDASLYKNIPQKVTAKVAAQQLKGKNKIMVLTGAGISAASGVPTFRGDGGFWTKSYGEETDPTKILTMAFFQENPELNWQWHHDFIEISSKGKPNKGHQAVLELQEYLFRQKRQFMLVTQNIDDYHPQLIKNSKILPKQSQKSEGDSDYAFTDHVYEIHGNVAYMHCSQTGPCLNNFYKVAAPPVPKCTQCGSIMKPHCMFFDESYNDIFYRKSAVEHFSKDLDALVVVGTALETNLAKKIVAGAINREDVPVIEFNLESAVDIGFNLQVLGKCEGSLPELVKELKVLEGKQQACIPKTQQKTTPQKKVLPIPHKKPIIKKK